MLIGTPKSGTTDLFSRIAMHPEVAQSHVKEPHWWTRRDATSKHFAGYLRTLSKGRKARTRVKSSNKLVLEGSASTFWDRGEYGRPTKSLVHMLVPEVLRRILGARTKFVVLLRDPVDRLYSAYNHFRHVQLNTELKKNASRRCVHAGCTEPTPMEFHMIATQAVSTFNTCLTRYTMVECAYYHVGWTTKRPANHKL